MEQWKDIPGYEGFYQVSNKGRVKSLLNNGRILSTPINTSGYPNVNLCKDGERRIWRVHRLVAIAFLGASNLQVNHINGVKRDNRVENLEWVSQSENGRHAHRTGLNKGVRGSNHPMAKLTDQQVTEIRIKYKPFKYTLSMLSKEYGVDDSIISGIIKNKRYAVR